MQNGMPIPNNSLATRNIAILTAAVWRMTPTTIMADPMVMLCLRPIRSLVYGTMGRAITAPMLKAAVMSPSRAPFGLSKSGSMIDQLSTFVHRAVYLQSSQGFTACNPFKIDPSYPEVISTPKTAGTRHKYNRRRFGRLYHGVVSISSNLLTSDSCATAKTSVCFVNAMTARCSKG